MCLARFEAAFWRKERHCEQQVDKGIIGYVGAGGNLPGLRTQAQSETMKAIAIGNACGKCSTTRRTVATT